jgi:hypothetical protein
VGQTRLDDAFWLAQLARHASALSATRSFPDWSVPADASQTADRNGIGMPTSFALAGSRHRDMG